MPKLIEYSNRNLSPTNQNCYYESTNKNSLSPTNQNCYYESTNKNSRIYHKEDKTSLKILLVFWTLNFPFTYLQVFLKTTQNLFIKIKIFQECLNWLSTLIGIDFDKQTLKS